MKRRTITAVLLSCVLTGVLGAALWFGARSGHGRALQGAAISTPAPPSPEVELAPLTERHAAPTNAVEGWTLRGRVVDTSGAPCARVSLVQRIHNAREVLGESAADGTFDLSPARFEGLLTTGPGAWAAVAPCALDATRASEEHVMVVARSVPVAGRVVDARGRGVCGATVGVRVAPHVAATLPASTTPAPSVLCPERSGPGGDFELDGVPALAGARLVASHSLLVGAARELSLQGEPAQLVLADPPAGVWLEVRVRTSHGESPQLLQGSFGETRLEFDCDFVARSVIRDGSLPLASDVVLVVQSAEHQTALVHGLAPKLRERGMGPVVEEVVLATGGLSIRGRVVDQLGAPCMLADVVAVPHGATSANERDYLAPSRRDGVFELTGLAPADYVVWCWLESPRIIVRSEPVAAGTSDLVLRAPSDSLAPVVRGRVTVVGGAPYAGALVRIKLGAREERAPRTMGADGCTTDASGRFELRDVPREYAWIIVHAEGCAPFSVAMESIDLTGELAIELTRPAWIVVTGLPEDVRHIDLEWEHERGFMGRVRTLAESPKRPVPVHRGSTVRLESCEGRARISARWAGGNLAPRDIELVAGETLVITP